LFKHLLLDSNLLSLSTLYTRFADPDSKKSSKLQKIPRLQTALEETYPFDTTLGSIVFSPTVIDAAYTDEEIKQGHAWILEKFFMRDFRLICVDPVTHLLWTISANNDIECVCVHNVAGKVHRPEWQKLTMVIDFLCYSKNIYFLSHNALVTGKASEKLVSKDKVYSFEFQAIGMCRSSMGVMVLGEDNVIYNFDKLNFKQFKHLGAEIFTNISAYEDIIAVSSPKKLLVLKFGFPDLEIELNFPISDILVTLNKVFVYGNEIIKSIEITSKSLQESDGGIEVHNVKQFCSAFKSILVLTNNSVLLITDLFAFKPLASVVHGLCLVGGIGIQNASDYSKSKKLKECLTPIRNASTFFNARGSGQIEVGNFSCILRNSFIVLENAVSVLVENGFGEILFESFTGFAVEQLFGSLRCGTGTNVCPDMLTFCQRMATHQWVFADKQSNSIIKPNTGVYQSISVSEPAKIFKLEKKKGNDTPPLGMNWLATRSPQLTRSRLNRDPHSITTTGRGKGKKRRFEEY
jgi:hypothetical protein